MALINVQSEITGTVWKIDVNIGDTVAVDDEIIILESMKMEIPVCTPVAGVLKEILVQEGEAVQEGQTLAVVES